MKGRCFGIVAVSVAAVIAAAIIIGQAAGLRLNVTDSAPHGLWHVRWPADAASIRRGDLVEVCPPVVPIVRLMGERGYLSAGDCAGSNVTPLLKPVSAVAGDTVHLTRGQPAAVNGVSLPNSAAMPFMPAWPEGDYAVKPGEVWLFSSYSAGSFDSRYFGPVELDRVRGLASPVAVRGDLEAMTLGVTRQ